MLLRQPALMVFDDLSSALDVETEQRLWEQLFNPFTHCPIHPSTCLVVSHRPAVLQRAHQVLVLNEGRLKPC